MAKCARCGNQLPPDASFCPQCALPVPGPPASSPVEAAAGVGLDTISGSQTIPNTPPPRTTAALADGQVFHARYTIERQLGAGAMGVVYAAKDQVSGQSVALKLINPSLAERPAARERFLREGIMARDVRHPNVVAMYDVGEADGQVYLVMEYVGGETLRKWLRRTLQEGRDVAFETARSIVRSVLEGLAAAHAAGVVHRDLKPENVMLLGDPQAGDGRLKILDFGIARAIGAPTHLTTTSSSTGTPLYMAPEQKTAAETVGPPADVYAATAMLYELLIGVAPEGRWGPPSREREDLPAGIDAVVEKGLASRPRSRYQTAAEYIQALDAIGGAKAAAEPEPPRPIPPEGPPTPPPPERPLQPPVGDRLVGRSRAQAPWAWALWDRMSKTQRIVLVLLALVAVGAVVGYYEGPKAGGGSGGDVIVEPQPQPPGPTAQGPAKGADEQVETKRPTATPPPTPAHAMIAGRWSDEITGTGFAVGYVDISQQGQEVGGSVYDMQGYQVGTFQGRVDGAVLDYSYVSADGTAGIGRGVLRADEIHLDIRAQDRATGNWVQHTLHKNHWPPQ